MTTKIGIAIPHTGSIHIKTFFSIIKTIKSIPFEWRLIEKEGSIIHWNRESLVSRAIEEGCSHVLFVDTDMVFEGDALGRLLKRDKDIIGVPYHLRTLPLTNTLKVHAEDGSILNEEHPGGLMRCAGVGTGFLLIRTSVFGKLSHPWFFWESDNKGEVVCGEDMWFCRKARQAGFDIWCDMTINMGHIGSYVY